MNINEALKIAREGKIETRTPAEQREIALALGLGGVVATPKVRQVSFKVSQARKAGYKADGSKLTPSQAANDKGSEGGALVIYGLGRFPITLWRSQAEELFGAFADDSDLGHIPELKAFAREHLAEFTVKGA